MRCKVNGQIGVSKPVKSFVLASEPRGHFLVRKTARKIDKKLALRDLNADVVPQLR
jgi:hypothetical protein